MLPILEKRVNKQSSFFLFSPCFTIHSLPGSNANFLTLSRLAERLTQSKLGSN